MGRLPLRDDAVAREEIEACLVRAVRDPLRPHPSGAPLARLNAVQGTVPRPSGLRRGTKQVHRRPAVGTIPAVLVLPVKRPQRTGQGTGPPQGATARVRRVRLPERALLLHTQRGP